jgi:hypothetical protein
MKNTFEHKRNLVIARKLTPIIGSTMIIVVWLLGASAFMDYMDAWRFDLKVAAFCLYVMLTLGVAVTLKLFVGLVDCIRGAVYHKSKIKR